MSLLFLCATLHLCPAPQYRVCWRVDSGIEYCGRIRTLDEALDVVDGAAKQFGWDFHVHRNAEGDKREQYSGVAGTEI